MNQLYPHDDSTSRRRLPTSSPGAFLRMTHPSPSPTPQPFPAIQLNDEKWEQTFQALTDHVMILDQAGIIMWANRAIQDYFAASCDTLVGLHYGIPYLGTTKPDGSDPWDTVLAGALSAVVEIWLPHLGGWFLVSCHPLRDQTGTQWGAVSVVKDITDRKRVEEALRKMAQAGPAAGSVAFLRMLVKDLAQALDVDYTLLAEFPGESKARAQTVAVWGREGFLENFVLEISEDVVPILSNAAWSQKGSSNLFLHPLIRNWHVSSFIGSPLTGSSGQIIGLLLAFSRKPAHQVHTAESIIRLFAVRGASELERKRAEEALRDSEERYRALVENAYDLIFETTPTGEFLYLSPNCLDTLGYTISELAEQNFFDLVHPDERIELADQFTRNIVNLQSCELVCRLQHKTGDWRWFESHSRPFRTSTGDIVAVVDARDITDRKRMEEARLQATKLESVGVLAGGIAHDFNNILTSVFANIGLARMISLKLPDSADKTIAERLAAAEKACLRARDLTKQLLTFAKGGAPIKNVASIATFITDTAEFALRGSNVRCELDLPADLWPVEVDEGQMSQVIQNLIINADQAMPDGGMIRVQARNHILDPDQELPLKEGRYVVIVIQDQGHGIAPDHLPRIFDPYFTTKPKGSGLGLATTYSIMKRHEGHISVHSELGRGTTFTLYLPGMTSRTLDQPDEKEPLATGSGKILIMDDEADIRDILGKMLGHLGYEVDSACNGQEALILYREAKEKGRPYTAVVVDLTIPGGMGGKETVQNLKTLDPQITALVSSGYSNDPVMADPESFGFKGVIAKPYNLSDLSRALTRALSQT